MKSSINIRRFLKKVKFKKVNGVTNGPLVIARMKNLYDRFRNFDVDHSTSHIDLFCPFFYGVRHCL